MKHITALTTEQVGGNAFVDFVHLPDGRLLGINEDYVCLYKDMDDFWNTTPDNKATIELVTRSVPKPTSPITSVSRAEYEALLHRIAVLEALMFTEFGVVL